MAEFKYLLLSLTIWAVVHLGYWALMLLAAFGLGQVFLRKQRFDSRVEHLVFALALGLGMCALLIFILGLVGLLRRKLLLILTLAGALAALIHLIRLPQTRRLFRLPAWQKYYSPRGTGIILLGIVGFAYWVLLLVSTQYPPLHWDAIAYHLVLCREYLAAHRVFPVLGVAFPVSPALNHMLFTWGLALKDDILAQMIEHTFLMLTAVGLYAWGKREKRPLFGVAVAAFWLSHPLVLYLGESAYVDVCLASYVFLGLYALRIFREHREARWWWYLSMALLAMAAGVKLPGLFFIILGTGLGLWVLLQSRLTWKPLAERLKQTDLGLNEHSQPLFTWKSFARGGALASLILLPWYAYIFYHTGNPIWPIFPEFGRGIWGAPAVITYVKGWLNSAGEPRTLANFLMLPIDWIRYPSRFQAEVNLTLSPLIIAWPLAWIVALWNRSVRWWALWALSFTCYWFFSPHQIRFWLSAVPLAGLALFESIRWFIEKVSRSHVLHAAVWITLTLAAIAWGSDGIIKEVQYKGWPPTDAKAREAFLSGWDGYNGVKYINEHANENETVGVIYGGWLNYYLRPHALDLHGLLQAGRLPSLRWPDDEQWVRWLESRNVTWIFFIHANQPTYLKIPEQNPVQRSFWPDYELVYSDSAAWVFHRKPVAADVSSGLYR